MVLERAGVNDTHRMFILSKMNLEKKEEIFKNMCKEFKLVLSGGPGQSKVEGTEQDKKAADDQTVKKEEEDAENAFITDNGCRYYKNNYRDSEMYLTEELINEVLEGEHPMSVQLNLEKTEKTRTER